VAVAVAVEEAVAVSSADQPARDDPSALYSRPSKTKRADTEKGRQGASIRRSLSAPLTDRDDVDLRAEVCRAHAHGVDATSWREATHEWREYIRSSGDTASVFENPEGEQVKGGDPNRFDPEYANKQYAKLKDLERGIRQDYRLPFTAMLSLTASSTTDQGEPLPPVDHLDDLLGSWEAVRRALSRSLEDRRWEYLAILEPHASGYLHVHVAVFVDGPIRRETFAPVIDAHLRNCDRAGRDAHSVEDGTAVSVNRVGRDARGNHATAEGAEFDSKTLSNLGSYLAEYLGTFGDDPLDAPDHQQAANAVLWATGRRRWRPSQGAQEYMATNRQEKASEWEFVGIEDKNGDVHEVSSGGGVERMTTTTDTVDADLDPPPDDGPERWGDLVEDWR